MVARIVLKLVICGSICGFVLFVAMQDVVTHQRINTRLNISIQQNTQSFNRLSPTRIGDGVMWIIHSSEINLKLQIAYYTGQAYDSRSPCSPLALSQHLIRKSENNYFNSASSKCISYTLICVLPSAEVHSLTPM